MEWIVIAIAAAGAAWVYAQFEWVTVTEMQSGVEYQKGKFARVAEAGRHLTFKPQF